MLDIVDGTTGCKVIAIVVRSVIGQDSPSDQMAEGVCELARCYAFQCAKENPFKVCGVDT